MSKEKKTGLKRDTSDKFYTNPEVAKQCIELVKSHIEYNKNNDIFIEPSAGCGSFSDIMRDEFKIVKAYDIEPHKDAKEIDKLDFLNLNIDNVDFLVDGLKNLSIENKNTNKKTDNKNADNKAKNKNADNKSKFHIIGNPPFGRQSSTAKKFIKKCAEYATTISFILPKSFKKESMKSCFPRSFHLIHEVDLNDKSFTVNGKIHKVPCVFQIWSKKEDGSLREIEEKQNPNGFKFVKKDEDPEFALRRVGVYAGTIYNEDIDNKSKQSHYFIILDDTIDQKKFMKEYNDKVKFDHNNTVGPKSVSKQEFIKKINVLIQDL